jgi:hypothetical protein
MNSAPSVYSIEYLTTNVIRVNFREYLPVGRSFRVQITNILNPSYVLSSAHGVTIAT